jgi:hypothetical protein
MRPDLIPVKDKLWVDISEPSRKEKILSSLIKNLTGNDPILVRKAHSNEMLEIKMYGKFVIISNHDPIFEDADDEAMWERLVVIDWHNPVSDANDDQKLAGKLTTDENRSRIFSCLVARAAKLYRNEKFYFKIHQSFFFDPETMLDKTEREVNDFFHYVLLCDNGGPFFAAVDSEESKTAIFKAYSLFHTRIKGQPISTSLGKRTFYEKLRNHTEKFLLVTKVRRSDDIYFKGVRIRWDRAGGQPLFQQNIDFPPAPPPQEYVP